jgi:hypothetical protein
MQQHKQRVEKPEKKHPVARRDKPITLHPLNLEEAVAGILRVPPEPKDHHPIEDDKRPVKKR